MTKITVKSDCGNSPKKSLLKDINIAFVNGDYDVLAESVTDDVIWKIIGDKTVKGKQSFITALKEMKIVEATELKLHSIITHGKAGVVNGLIKMPNGNHFAFSDVYEFNNAKGSKVKAITSYVIKI